jgi:hypothetical protein
MSASIFLLKIDQTGIVRFALNIVVLHFTVFFSETPRHFLSAKKCFNHATLLILPKFTCGYSPSFSWKYFNFFLNPNNFLAISVTHFWCYSTTLLYATLSYDTLRYSTLLSPTLRYSTLLWEEIENQTVPKPKVKSQNMSAEENYPNSYIT